MQQIIGTTTTYHGTEHGYLTGYTVRIVAVFKETDDGEDCVYLRDDDTIKRAGGLNAGDRVEVQPWLEKEARFSFVTSDPLAADLACFKHLR